MSSMMSGLGATGSATSWSDIGTAGASTGMPNESFVGSTYGPAGGPAGSTVSGTGQNLLGFAASPFQTNTAQQTQGAPGATGSAWQSLSKGIGMVSPIAGPIVGGIGALMQGNQAYAQGAEQARELQQQAQLERFQAGTQIAANDYQAMQKLGSIRSSAGASGVMASSGSTQQDIMQSTHAAKLNDMYTYFSGQLASQRDLYKAAIARYQGSQARAAGEVGLGMGILTSGMNAASMGAGPGTA